MIVISALNDLANSCVNALYYDTFSGTVKIWLGEYTATPLDTTWTPTVGQWYFCEYSYNLEVGSIELLVDGVSIYSSSVPTMSFLANFFLYGINMTGSEWVNESEAHYDNMIISLNPNRNLYLLRDTEVCPKVT